MCGVCDPDTTNDNITCSDCVGVPNGNNKTCIDCKGVSNGLSKVDPCGVCDGDGSSCKCPYVPVELNKLNFIKQAKVIANNKTIKYYNSAIKCDGKVSKKSKKSIEDTKVLLDQFIQVVNSIPTEVELCPGECVDVFIKTQLVQLQTILKGLYKKASDAQHGARRACKTTLAGVNTTSKLVILLDNQIKECHDKNKVCN